MMWPSGVNLAVTGSGAPPAQAARSARVSLTPARGFTRCAIMTDLIRDSLATGAMPLWLQLPAGGAMTARFISAVVEDAAIAFQLGASTPRRRSLVDVARSSLPLSHGQAN